MSGSRPEAPIMPIVYQRGPSRWSSEWTRIGPENTEDREAIIDLLNAFSHLVVIPSPDDLYHYMFDQNPDRKSDYAQPQDPSDSSIFFTAAFTQPINNLITILPAISVGDPIKFFKYLRSRKFPNNRDKIVFAREHNTELFINVPIYLINEGATPLITDSYSEYAATPERGNEFQVTLNTQTYTVLPSQGRQQESLIMPLRSGARLRFGPFSRHLID